MIKPIKDFIEDLKPAGFQILIYPYGEGSDVFIFQIKPMYPIQNDNIISILEQFWFDLELKFGEDSIVRVENEDGTGVRSVTCDIHMNNYKLHKRKNIIKSVLSNGSLEKES